MKWKQLWTDVWVPLSHQILSTGALLVDEIHQKQLWTDVWVHFLWMKYIKNNHYEQMCEYLHHIISHIKFFQQLVHFSLMKWNQLQTDVWVVPSSHQEILSTSALLVDEILTDVWVHSTIIVLLCFIIFNQSS